MSFLFPDFMVWVDLSPLDCVYHDCRDIKIIDYLNNKVNNKRQACKIFPHHFAFDYFESLDFTTDEILSIIDVYKLPLDKNLYDVLKIRLAKLDKLDSKDVETISMQLSKKIAKMQHNCLNHAILRDSYAGISSWDVGNVKDMSYMFYQNESFNENIQSWNVSKVENMYQMFGYTQKFNQDLNSWDISNVKFLHNIFFKAQSMETKNILKWLKLQDSNISKKADSKEKSFTTESNLPTLAKDLGI
ncbi:BspA family leucine-rich repeat surface protein [Helicobacter saguini]|uniref:BspA family leucine-rich repeat surface protein n=2 Tax=Helicobacter saguini TaxID=1548018 RepID=A0A347VU27_9HELI|nr:BspA family leucine-rich repeat surface protein [Helicobacter saguini]MWV68376.1 BspA family leucine-rich repeat surface protein [Helicobacter saguini]MWV70160.1 BspA family leucine-rich repeat surface protein [Helicobacter saguini]MWV72063.1 BspA family leucine-rich repeat surface protein [Helicobacter saguini]TLD93775.1 BspA family leucine-rich repeat surface protein [Helicobacter saguini]